MWTVDRKAADNLWMCRPAANRGFHSWVPYSSSWPIQQSFRPCIHYQGIDFSCCKYWLFQAIWCLFGKSKISWRNSWSFLHVVVSCLMNSVKVGKSYGSITLQFLCKTAGHLPWFLYNRLCLSFHVVYDMFAFIFPDSVRWLCSVINMKSFSLKTPIDLHVFSLARTCILQLYSSLCCVLCREPSNTKNGFLPWNFSMNSIVYFWYSYSKFVG